MGFKIIRKLNENQTAVLIISSRHLEEEFRSLCRISVDFENDYDNRHEHYPSSYFRSYDDNFYNYYGDISDSTYIFDWYLLKHYRIETDLIDDPNDPYFNVKDDIKRIYEDGYEYY